MGRSYRAGSDLTERDRFWLRVSPEGECWIWQGHKSAAGYGLISRLRDGVRKAVSAHRVAWEYVRGPIPPGLNVCHHCDNPPCVRPDHLFLGTQADNLRDMDAKGRRRQGSIPTGSNAVRAVMSVELGREMQRLHAQGVTQLALADRFGVSKGTVYNVLRGTHWTVR